jgi:hypothetical protein
MIRYGRKRTRRELALERLICCKTICCTHPIGCRTTCLFHRDFIRKSSPGDDRACREGYSTTAHHGRLRAILAKQDGTAQGDNAVDLASESASQNQWSTTSNGGVCPCRHSEAMLPGWRRGTKSNLLPACDLIAIPAGSCSALPTPCRNSPAV